MGIRILCLALFGSLAALCAVAAPLKPGMVFTPTQRAHWAWKSPAASPIPRVQGRSWVRNPVDAFILAGLEARRLRPAPPASSEVLLRRVAFVLTGLPPSTAEADAFLQDRRAGAYERMVGRYLDSPAFGERWARHWLDLARYADTNGFEHDEVRPEMWRYRDYVVRAFNSDMPYSRFVEEQIAGDELLPARPEAWIATGLQLLGPDMTDAASQAARRQHTLNDMTDTTGLVFLGLTLGCARCHDHKYEPLSQADYYRFQAFFAPAQFRTDLPIGTREEQERYTRALSAHGARLQVVDAALEAIAGGAREVARGEKLALLPEDVRTAFATLGPRRTPGQQVLVRRNLPLIEPKPEQLTPRLPAADRPRYEVLLRQREGILKDRPAPPPRAVGLWSDRASPAVARILMRGELAQPAETVHAGFPEILGGVPTPAGDSRGGAVPLDRRALARWITRPEHPLTYRVWANRVWQHVFGRGIVRTPSDFGVRGEVPTHPELLDWLARRLAHSSSSGMQGAPAGSTPLPAPAIGVAGLHIGSPAGPKALLRLLLTSSTFRQSSTSAPATRAADPENRWFSRMNRTRLEAEAIRDAMLAVSGRLNRKSGGPGVLPPLPEDVLPRSSAQKAWPVTPDPAEHVRRSLYLFVRRNLTFPALEPFDAPDTNLSCARRDTSTSAPQALTLLNSDEALHCARALAGRVLREAASEETRVVLAYRLTLARRPQPEELRLGREFLARQAALSGEAAPTSLPVPTAPEMAAAQGVAWTAYCLALLNLNEFVYVD